MTDSQLYSRRLLPKGHGYPLFRPQPSDDLPIEYRRTGASIGDVGVITVDGYFDFIFNICMPADSSINWLGVPDRFDRVVLDTGAIFHARNHHRPGCDISNTTIKKRRLDLNAAVEDNVFLPMGAGATVEITASSKEIAMLLLPQGASRSNLRSLQKFEDYALTHACDWYSFVNGKLGRKVENGSRYLVTGVDKTSSWSVASLESRSEDNQVSMKLTAGLVGSGGVACAWKWQSDNSASLCSGPDPAPGEEDWFDHQTVFLRGYKVAVRPYLLAALKGSIKVSNIDNLKPADILRRSTVVPHAQSSSSKSRVSREGSTPTGSPWDSELLAQLEDSGMFAQLEATADLEPELEPILTIQQYHPSSAINSYLLDIKGASGLGVDSVATHDDVWMSVINSDEIDMPNDEELLGRVLKKYSIGMKCRGHAACIDMESAEDPAEVVPAASAPSKRFSRSKLTRSLEIAREAVQFDSANDPKAAISSYGRALALLREVISRSDSEESRTEIVPRRRASAKEEANRLQTIANTYQDRMNVLSLIHGIPIPEFPKDDDAERMAPALEDRPSSPGLLGAPSSSESASVSLASSVQALDLQTKSVLDHHEPANVRTD